MSEVAQGGRDAAGVVWLSLGGPGAVVGAAVTRTNTYVLH